MDPGDTPSLKNLFYEGGLEADSEAPAYPDRDFPIHKYSNFRLLFIFSKESLIPHWVFDCKLFYYENICFIRTLTLKI
jgi:hypothetical protein